MHSWRLTILFSIIVIVIAGHGHGPAALLSLSYPCSRWSSGAEGRKQRGDLAMTRSLRVQNNDGTGQLDVTVGERTQENARRDCNTATALAHPKHRASSCCVHAGIQVSCRSPPCPCSSSAAVARTVPPSPSHPALRVLDPRTTWSNDRQGRRCRSCSGRHLRLPPQGALGSSTQRPRRGRKPPGCSTLPRLT